MITILCGCFSTERSEERQSFKAYTSFTDSAPAASNPEEAIHQLIEGNSRFIHQERRWVQTSSKSIEPNSSFLLLINAGAGNVVPEDIFDLPPGSVPVLTWSSNKTNWTELDAGVKRGVKVILVLLPYEDNLSQYAAIVNMNTKTSQILNTIFQLLQSGNHSLSQRIAQKECLLIGAVLHPENKRLILLSSAH